VYLVHDCFVVVLANGASKLDLDVGVGLRRVQELQKDLALKAS
jgi:hypothetical protein